jgi:hypothetical protein
VGADGGRVVDGEHVIDQVMVLIDKKAKKKQARYTKQF